jgi:aminopeptidase-like protein
VQDEIEELNHYLERLFPITRSITGNGNRETLKILQEIAPLNIIEYPTGQEVYDWNIPKEWNIRDGWIKNSSGEKIIDFKNCNLHIVSYSCSVHKKIKFSQLQTHLHCLEKLPDAVPYRTSYYKESWGFCVSFNQYKKLFNEDEEYEVFIDSSCEDGSLTIGECLIEGKSKEEYLISCYICHPSMANDSLSGVIATAFVARELLKIQSELEFSYRIIFVPETIGAIAYCANNEKAMKSIKNGLVVTTCGGAGKYGYKQSWDSNNFINSMIEDVFNDNQVEYIKYPFAIGGSDERQYSSQGFRINITTITKDKYYEYDYYHTSLDNLDFVKAEYISKSIRLYLCLLTKLDKNIRYKNLKPNCEVRLGKYNLYPDIGGSFSPSDTLSEVELILWLLFYFDGNKTTYEISKILNISVESVYEISKILEANGILGRVYE